MDSVPKNTEAPQESNYQLIYNLVFLLSYS